MQVNKASPNLDDLDLNPLFVQADPGNNKRYCESLEINKVPKNVSNQTGQIEIKTGETDNSDTFLNITYSGLDLSGNRYFLKSKEAIINKENQKIINMKGVEATFYFKDGTTLEVFSKIGVYNNETLDIDFQKDVKAFYQESILFSERAQFSNQNGFLTVTDEVKVIDPKGNLEADKLIFDMNSPERSDVSVATTSIPPLSESEKTSMLIVSSASGFKFMS